MPILVDSAGRPLMAGSLPLEVTDGVSAGIPTSGLVARWEGDAGVTVSGSDITTWTDSVGSRALALVSADDPGFATVAPGGTASVSLTNGAGMRLSGVGSLPVEANARTSVLCFRPGVVTFFGGFGWGSGTATGTSFVLGCDADGGLMLDYFGGRISGTASANLDWVVLVGTYDGTTARLYENGTEVGSATVALDTGTDFTNLALSFSGFNTEGDYGFCAAWSRVLSAAEIAQVVAYCQARWVTDITAPSLSSAGLSAATSVSLAWAVTTDEAGGTLYVSPQTTATPLSVAAIKSTGASRAVSVAGTETGSFTGLTPETTYYLHAMHEDAAGNPSAVTVSAGVATLAADVTAPTLSSPTGTATGATTASGTVSTNEGNGTLYWVVTTSATAPTAAQVRAGQDNAGAAAAASGSQGVSATGSQAITASGLASGTAYRVHYHHQDAAGNDSTVSTSAALTTTTVSGALPIGYAEIASWGASEYDPQWAFLPNILESEYDTLIGGLTANKSATPANIATVLAGLVAGDVVELADGSYGTALNALIGDAFASEVIIYAANLHGATATRVELTGASNVTLLGLDFGSGPASPSIPQQSIYAISGSNFEFGYCKGAAINLRNISGVNIHHCFFDMAHPGLTYTVQQQGWNCIYLLTCSSVTITDTICARPNSDPLRLDQVTGATVTGFLGIGGGALWTLDDANGGGRDNTAGGFHSDGMQTYSASSPGTGGGISITNFAIVPNPNVTDRKGAQGLHLDGLYQSGAWTITDGIILATLNDRCVSVNGASTTCTYARLSCLSFQDAIVGATNAAAIRCPTNSATHSVTDCICSGVQVGITPATLVVETGNLEFSVPGNGNLPPVYEMTNSGTFHRVADWAVVSPYDDTKGAAALLQTINARVTAAGV